MLQVVDSEGEADVVKKRNGNKEIGFSRVEIDKLGTSCIERIALGCMLLYVHSPKYIFVASLPYIDSTVK